MTVALAILIAALNTATFATKGIVRTCLRVAIVVLLVIGIAIADRIWLRLGFGLGVVVAIASWWFGEKRQKTALKQAE